jgi:hypothetical protein
MDPWDVMSTANTPWMAPHPFFTELDVQGRPIFRIGPGLNAANMSAMGWLDMSRVWRPEPYESSMTVQLRPLHRVDLPGYLCAQVGQYFIEFRMNELWDAGLDSPLVLIHDLFDGRSYVYAGDSGRFGLLGDTSSFVRQTTLTQTKHEQGVMPRFGGGFRAAATV